MAGDRFRWADCQLAELRKCPRPCRVCEALAALPQTLDDTYNRILTAIVPQSRQEAVNALTWLVGSKQALTVAELAEAAIIDLEDDGDIDITERLFDTNHIIIVLSGLVTITSHGSIRLAHFSVEKYLTSDRLGNSPMSKFRVSIPACRSKLLSACLRYQQTSSIEEKIREAAKFEMSEASKAQMTKLWPLAEHATLLWLVYARDHTAGDATTTSIVNFLKCEAAVFLDNSRILGSISTSNAAQTRGDSMSIPSQASR